MTKWILVLASVAVLQAQPISYGAKVGAPVNDPARASPSLVSSPSRWLGGPFVELHLPRRLSVEFSALFRTSRENQSRPFQLGGAQNAYLVSSLDQVKTWDFPLLLKFVSPKARFGPSWVSAEPGHTGAVSSRRSIPAWGLGIPAVRRSIPFLGRSEGFKARR